VTIHSEEPTPATIPHNCIDRACRREHFVSTPNALDRLLEPAEATAIIRAHTHALPTERASLTDLAGRLLMEDVTSDEDQPPFPAATMDGYAVVSDDTDPVRRIVGDQFAGTMEALHVQRGTAAYITTGAPLPPGADAVVQIERTAQTAGGVRIDDVPRAGQNIRRVGSDLKRGDRVLAAGTVLTPAAVGLLASLGRTDALVTRRPRVSVLATGDELVEPGQPVGPGQIRDSNRFALVAALAPLGVTVRYAGLAPDTDEAQRAFLIERIADSDVVITSGGVSMGRKDLIKGLLVELATVHFRQLRMRPGKPFTFATAGPEGKTLLFGLPGNPVSGLVGFEVFVRPALLAMQGHTVVDRARARVRLAHGVTPIDRIDYMRVTLRRAEDGVLEAASTGPQQSSRLASFIGANALAIIPPRATPYAAGEMVEALLFDPA
jgi:gephyrin